LNPIATPLVFRSPVAVFIAVGMVVALVVHGLSWMLMSMLLSPSTALEQSSRQVGLAVWWVAASIFLWSVQSPGSRFKAALLSVGCVLFTGFVGTLAVVFAQIQNPNDYSAGVHIVVLLGVLIAQTLLALPACAVLQWIVLRPNRLGSAASGSGPGFESS
jgi:hypothetical protein